MYREELLHTAQARRLSLERAWQTLLHVRPNLWRHRQSDIDDPLFFLSPRGRQDPDAELQATLAAFFEPPPEPGADSQTHAQCRFPARYQWLKQTLAIDPSRLPEVRCDRFEEWRSRLNADSVSLIFASYYFNNPASMYGHTFLRLGRPAQDPTAGNPLLDYTVNFAADADARNGALYAINGLFGGYRGRYSTMPYYMKVQEYVTLDSRDLWEYPLHLNPPQVDRLVRHLWEMGGGSMSYFFLNKNCSYQLMPLLEAADPTLDLAGPFWLKTIPSDTLRRVRSAPGFSGDGVRRLSYRNAMLARRARLTPAEIHLAEQWAVSSVAPERPCRGPILPCMEDVRRALILESAYDLFRYRTGFSRDQAEAVQRQEQSLLLERSRIAVSTPPVLAALSGDPAAIAPEQGHRSGRIGVMQGFSSRSPFQEIDLRPALHDSDDPPAGYLPASTLEMFHTRLRWDDRRSTAYVEDFTLIHLKALTDWDSWTRKPSWKVNVGLHVAHELDRDPENSLYTGVSLGSGFSAKLPVSIPVRTYALAEIDGGAGHALDPGRFGGGASAGIVAEWLPALRTRAEVRHIHYVAGGPDSTTHWQVVPSWSVRERLELRIILERWNRYNEARVGLWWFI